MVDYRIVVTDLTNNPLGELLDFKSLRFQKVLNREGECMVGISLKSPSLTSGLIQLGKRDIYIYRNDDIVWGGRLLNYVGALTAKDDIITFVAKGFFHLLKKRLVPSSKTNVDAGEIVWQWIV